MRETTVRSAEVRRYGAVGLDTWRLSASRTATAGTNNEPEHEKAEAAENRGT